MKTILKGSFCALATYIYVVGVAVLMSHGEKIFTGQNFFMPAAILSLLVLSVAVVGLLIFGLPVWHYLQGKKKESVIILISTVITFFLLTTLTFILIKISNR